MIDLLRNYLKLSFSISVCASCCRWTPRLWRSCYQVICRGMLLYNIIAFFLLHMKMGDLYGFVFRFICGFGDLDTTIVQCILQSMQNRAISDIPFWCRVRRLSFCSLPDLHHSVQELLGLLYNKSLNSLCSCVLYSFWDFWCCELYAYHNYGKSVFQFCTQSPAALQHVQDSYLVA